MTAVALGRSAVPPTSPLRASAGMSGDTLTSSDGASTSVILAREDDELGPVLRVRHRTTRVGQLAGPHWHPDLQERFTVRAGRLGFAVDGEWRSLGPGESVDVTSRQVHESRCEAGELVMDHEVRPPRQHQEMFEFMHALDRAGRLTRAGIPANPLALGMLWQFQDGYIVGPSPRVQRIVFGGLDRLARRIGYHRRLATRVGRPVDHWS